MFNVAPYLSTCLIKPNSWLASDCACDFDREIVSIETKSPKKKKKKACKDSIQRRDKTVFFLLSFFLSFFFLFLGAGVGCST